jgi:NADPH:quinone reductase-like Zn-dependent oxidoreductase
MYRYEFSDAISLKSLRLAERPDPVPGPHYACRGAELRRPAIERGRYHIGVSPPLVPLSDGAGEIIETDEAVNRFQVGDLVCPTFLPDWHDGPFRASVVGRRLGGPTDGVLTKRMCFMRRRRSEPPSSGCC